jgi:hypothetical protein
MHEPLIVGKVIVILLGFFIAYQAYDGYRIHNSPAMLYLSIGFVLISVASGIEGILFELFHVDIFLAGTIQTIIAALGMLTVLYSLYGNHGTAVAK